MNVQTIIYPWLLRSDIGHFLARSEQAFFQAAIQVRENDWILNINTPDHFFQPNENILLNYVRQRPFTPATVVADAAQMPWENYLFDRIIAAHVLDGCKNPTLLLAQWHRITRPQGLLLITLCNPYSLWQCCPSLLPIPRTQLLSPKFVIEQAEQVGWQLEQYHFLLHAPFFRQPENRWVHRLINQSIALCCPQTALVYGLVLSKQQAGVHPIYDAAYSFSLPHFGQLAAVQNHPFSGSTPCKTLPITPHKPSTISYNTSPPTLQPY